MKIYHIDRDFKKSLKEQKQEIKKTYKNVVEMFSDGKKIHVFAD